MGVAHGFSKTERKFFLLYLGIGLEGIKIFNWKRAYTLVDNLTTQKFCGRGQKVLIRTRNLTFAKHVLLIHKKRVETVEIFFANLWKLSKYAILRTKRKQSLATCLSRIILTQKRKVVFLKKVWTLTKYLSYHYYWLAEWVCDINNRFRFITAQLFRQAGTLSTPTPTIHDPIETWKLFPQPSSWKLASHCQNCELT